MKKNFHKANHVDKAISWVLTSGVQVIRTGDLAQVLALSNIQEANLLDYLRKKGFLVRLMRGLYLAPETLPLGKWSPSPYKALSVLMDEVQAKYQITGLFAFNYYNLTQQVPQIMSVYNTVLSGNKQISDTLRFAFIKITGERLGATETITIDDKNYVFISSFARTLLDAVYDHNRFGTLPEAYGWISRQKDNKQLIHEFVNVTLRFSNIGTQRRIGWLLEQLGIDNTPYKRLKQSLPDSQSIIPLVPGKPAIGTVNKAWGVIINDNIKLFT